MIPRLLFRDGASIDEILYEGMVAREPPEHTLSQKIQAAVAHMRPIRRIFPILQGDDRRPHALSGFTRCRCTENLAVRFLYGMKQSFLAAFMHSIGKHLSEYIDEHRARHFSCGISPHAVRHDIRIRRYEGACILVALAHLSPVRRFRDFQKNHLSNLSVTKPMRMRSPGFR